MPIAFLQLLGNHRRHRFFNGLRQFGRRLAEIRCPFNEARHGNRSVGGHELGCSGKKYIPALINRAVNLYGCQAPDGGISQIREGLFLIKVIEIKFNVCYFCLADVLIHEMFPPGCGVMSRKTAETFELRGLSFFGSLFIFVH